MCKNKYFNLISAVWSLSTRRHRRIASRNCIACISPSARRFVPSSRSSCQLHKSKNANCFRSLGSWANVHWKTERLEIWGIKMPFAIIASPENLCQFASLFCVAEGKWKFCACRISPKIAGRNKKIRHKKSTNAKSDCFEDWRRDRMIECRLNSTTLCGKTNVRAFLFSARMDGLKTHKNYSPRNVSKPNVDKWPSGGNLRPQNDENAQFRDGLRR